MKKILLMAFAIVNLTSAMAQISATKALAPTPPMGWMTWNLFADNIDEQMLREMADAMVSEGFRDAGYNYLFIDDGWQGGRDNRNNIIADPKKFPSGIKALADYVHARGLKLGIYSDAAQLTCAGYTASLGFEQQDAKTFASWGIDYLKYDYCHAPVDVETAKLRYKKMADALRGCGRDIVLGVCEWGPRKPWLWASAAGGQLWRTTYDVRDMWIDTVHKGGKGIMNIVEETAPLHEYAGPEVGWNDMDMLVVGLKGTGGPSSDLGGKGCTDTEYESQMSLWCMLCSPLAMTNDLRHLGQAEKRILLNKEIIAINQDPLGRQAERKLKTDVLQVFVKPLAEGKWAIALLNTGDKALKHHQNFTDLGLEGKYKVRNVWTHQDLSRKATSWKGNIEPHQTIVLVLE